MSVLAAIPNSDNTDQMRSSSSRTVPHGLPYVLSPPTSSNSQEEDQGMLDAATDPRLNQAGSWSQQGNHGLGLMSSYPDSTAADYCDVTRPLPSAYPWTGHYATAPHLQPATHIGAFRRDSWGEGCDPVSTLPNSNAWHPSSSSNVYDASPSMSTYSSSSRPSAMSSPYTHPEDGVRTMGSPMIKLEDMPEPHLSGVAYYHDGSSMERSMLVQPGDLITQPMFIDHGYPSSSYGDMYPPDEKFIDYKPPGPGQIIRSLQGHRRNNPHQYPIQTPDEIVADILEDRNQKRGFTNEDNANCACEQCGKLFQRTFNLRAHMETHDPNRSQPHACQYPRCSKRFVRRTDLVRHEQSVHIKSRVFRCPLCDSSFSRRDTLRRHVGDGCPKRTEVKKRVSKPYLSSANSTTGTSPGTASRASSSQSPSQSPPLQHQQRLQQQHSFRPQASSPPPPPPRASAAARPQRR